MASTSQASRRRRAELVWVTSVLLYVIARFLIAYGTLHRYGLNVWIFGFLDIATAVPYGIGTARLVTSIVDGHIQRAARWGIVSAASFLAPYLYIALSGQDKHMPVLVWAVLGLLVASLGVNAALTVRRKVRLNEIGTEVVAESPTAASLRPEDEAPDRLLSP